MRSAPWNPSRLDVLAFARSGAEVQGEQPAASWPRLAEMLLPAPPQPEPQRDGMFSWSVQGEHSQKAGREPRVVLHIRLRGRVWQCCQRCLEACHVDMDLACRLRFVADEGQAARLDEASDDEDVLALSARFDLLGFLEDEAIMALPLVPRHDACPVPLPVPVPLAGSGADDAAEEAPSEEAPSAPHPFAALARLRGRP